MAKTTKTKPITTGAPVSSSDSMFNHKMYNKTENIILPPNRSKNSTRVERITCFIPTVIYRRLSMDAAFMGMNTHEMIRYALIGFLVESDTRRERKAAREAKKKSQPV